jgi:hypothetical protein
VELRHNNARIGTHWKRERDRVREKELFYVQRDNSETTKTEEKT